MLKILCLILCITRALSSCDMWIKSDQVNWSQLFCDQVNKESQSIELRGSCLTDPKVLLSLSQALKRGVALEICMENLSKRQKACLAPLALQGAKVHYLAQDRSKSYPQKWGFCLFGTRVIWLGCCHFPRASSNIRTKCAALIENSSLCTELRAEFLELVEESKNDS